LRERAMRELAAENQARLGEVTPPPVSTSEAA